MGKQRLAEVEEKEPKQWGLGTGEKVLNQAHLLVAIPAAQADHVQASATQVLEHCGGDIGQMLQFSACGVQGLVGDGVPGRGARVVQVQVALLQGPSLPLQALLDVDHGLHGVRPRRKIAVHSERRGQHCLCP